MLAKIIRLGVLAGAGYAAWKMYSRQSQPFFRQALRAAAADLAAVRSAQLRGAGAELRRFAQQLEHEYGQHIVQLAEASGLDDLQPDARQRATLQQLDLHQGEAYDRTWLRHMALSHHTAIELYQREVDRDGPGAALAAEALPTLRGHARRVAQLQLGEVGSAVPSARSERVEGTEGAHA